MTDEPERDDRAELIDRPSDGYRVAARIESRASRRSRILAALAALLVVVWAAAVVNGRPDPHPRPSEIAEASPGPSVTDPNAPPQATFPPDVELVQPAAALGKVPVVLDGLAFLDLRTGTVVRSIGQDLAQWRFALPDGAACVCLEGAGGLNPPALHLYHWDRNGAIDAANTLGAWLPSEQTVTLVDAVLTPDRAAAVVGSVVQEGATWALRIQQVPFEGEVSETDLAPFDLASLGDPARLQLRLFLAPDGRRLRITIEQLADDLAAVTGSEHSWIATRRGDKIGPITPASDAKPDAELASCEQQAWADADTFAQLCETSQPDGAGHVAATVRLLRADGAVIEAPIGAVLQSESIGWLIDGQQGVIYAWSPIGHRITRITARTGDSIDRQYAPTDGMDAASLQAVQPDAARSVPFTVPAIWQPLAPASQPLANPLVGSPDGSLLYATGDAFDTGAPGLSGPDSSGIWVFDSGTLGLVAHWRPVAAYQSLALAPGQRYVLALGGPGPSEVGTFGNHGPELVIHDIADGSVVAVHRELVLRLGGMPTFLP